MLVNGTSASGKRIEVGEDFSILIKKPSVYVDEFTDETLLMIFRPKERLDNYKEGKFSIDDETPINGKFNLLRSGTFTHNVDAKDYNPSTVLDDIDINNTLKKMSAEAKNISLNLSFNGNSKSLGDDDGFKRMYKVCIDTPTLKAGYYTMGILGRTTYVPVIFTTHGAYSGQIRFSEEDFEDNEEWIESLLSTLQPLNEEKMDINTIELKELEKITYSKETITAGSLIINKANELNYVEKENLPDKFDLIATSKSFKKSKIKYNDAPVGICINKPMVSDVLTQIWKLDKKDVEKNIIDNFKKSLINSLGKYDKEVKLLKLEDNYAVIYGQANSSQPDEPYWTSYSFAIFHNDMTYFGMLYFNCNKPKTSDVERIVEDFLNNISIDNKKADSKSKEERIRILGQFAAKDGKIDAVKVNNMFFEDIIFNNPEEIVYKNNKHSITGLQLNIEKVDDFPSIKDNYQTFVLEINKVMEELESNGNLVVNSNQYHKNFNKVTKREPITGLIYLLFAAWHMIKIVEEKKNSYKVLVDQNLIHGLPNGYSRLMEYIKTLRKYNGLIEDFDAEFVGVMNADGPTGVISNSVENSDTFKSIYKMNSKDINLKANDIKEESNDLIIKDEIDINVLKYLNHEIPLIYKDIQKQASIIEKNKQSLLKHKDMESFLDALMEVKDDDKVFNWKVNMSFVGYGGGGTFALTRYLEQLKVDTPFHPDSEYRINYEYSYDDDPKEFLEEILKLYKSKTETEVRKDIILLINSYIDNGITMKPSKEKLMFNSVIYDYDKEDKDFKEEDFYKPLNSKNNDGGKSKSSSVDEIFTDDGVNYDELIKLMKDGKHKMKTEVEGFQELIDDKLRPIRYDEDSYDIDAVIEMVEPAADDFGNNAAQTVELMDKSARAPMEECKSEETIKTIAQTILDTIKYFDKVVINWGFRRYHSSYRYDVPRNIISIKKYWEDKLDNLPSVKKQKEEQKRREEENKKRIQELKEQWEKDCENIKEKKKADLEKYTKDTRKKYDDKIVKAQRDIDDEIGDLEADKRITERALKTQEEELAKLGMFNFSKKAEWKGYIENSTQKLADLDEKIEQKEKEKKTSKQNLEKEYEKTISEYEKELDNKYQLPAKPKELLDSATQTRNPELTRTEKENNRLKEVIMDAIIDLCRPVRTTDLQEYSDELAEISNQKLSALLMQLVNENKLDRVIDKHMSYFIFKD